ncbi:coatomer subunit epsilon SCDLUD_000305 [Saccharomycodes ludwigii]|uniref:coatomer subunit epsilon n=1 Tax=Saccharomycodes ludwigii TaxID=36035 RepID=UPI001E845224|nr:hypothetical protein SCDLUD_000305 [Saccharomycodes ludwigii]KAH3902720.1 hypothetical protein SCDLUD_000305 [Saccharomycodes ludwigii]
MNTFTVKQEYYTGNYKAVLKEVAKYNKTSDETLLFYKTKAEIALGEFELLPEDGSSSSLTKVINNYAAFIKDHKKLANLQKSIKDSSLYAINLLASAYFINGDIEESLTTCIDNLDSANVPGSCELLLLAIQVALFSGEVKKASNLYSNFVSNNEEYDNDNEIIINFCESYINFVLNKETTEGNFYFFEDMVHTHPSYKTNLGLLNLHLQQGHLEEASSIVDLLESEFYDLERPRFLPDLLSNKIVLGLQKGENVDDIRVQLLELDSNHSWCKAHTDVEQKMSVIINKYQI